MTMSSEDAHLYFKHLPFYTDITSAPPSPLPVQSNSPIAQDTTTYNPLDLCTPDDLQKFGIIPEFLGRIPVTTALSPLSIPHLFRVLTEPRNSIIAQKTLLFNTFGSELRFTTPALHEIAKQAFKLGTGARGVRTIVEELLGEAVYEVPGSSVRYVLVGEAAARRKQKVGYFSRGQGHVFRGEWEREEGEWEEKVRAQELLRTGSDREDRDFAAFRERAGSGM
jgi:ATP-dependent Clp protease ATP-binding subunit ClpX